jgi:hypothetical protein
MIRIAVTLALLSSLLILYFAGDHSTAVALCAATTDLTGTWNTEDGGTYYIRQIGNDIWWFGSKSITTATHDTLTLYSNVFKGIRNGTDVFGTWADVPEGATKHYGGLELKLIQSSGSIKTMIKAFSSGGFGLSTWQRAPCLDTIGHPIP